MLGLGGSVPSVFAPSATPKPVPGLTMLRDLVFSDGESACGLHEDGSVSCLGRNDAGQLGDGTTISRSTPAPVPGLHDIVALEVVHERFYALRDDGQAFSWGTASYGSTTDLVPVAVPELAGAASLTSALDGVRADGTVVGPRAASFAGLYVRDIAGECALRRDGRVHCLPPDGADPSYMPPDPGLAGATALDVMYGDGCAVADGQLECWRRVVPPSPFSGLTRIPLGHVVEVRLTLVGHRCARRTDGSVWCWGPNDVGQVGNGTTDTYVSAPVRAL